MYMLNLDSSWSDSGKEILNAEFDLTLLDATFYTNSDFVCEAKHRWLCQFYTRH